MKKNINVVLIGPVAVGKSTVAEQLSQLLGLPFVKMDDYRLAYYREIGYEDDFKTSILEKEGWSGVMHYWKVFDAYSVERLVIDYPGHILDMGGGSTYCVFPEDLQRLKKAFKKSSVFLLLPYSDKNKSLTYLNKRTGWKKTGRNINRDILDNGSNEILASHIIYTAGKTPWQLAKEIANHINFSNFKK